MEMSVRAALPNTKIYQTSGLHSWIIQLQVIIIQQQPLYLIIFIILVPEKKSQHFTIPVQYLHCSGSGGSDSTKGGLSNPYLKEVYRKHLE